MSIPQYTTPTFLLTFEEDELDLTQAENVYVTFHAKNYDLTKTGNDLTVEAKSISVYLTQDETANFNEGVVEVQANWTSASGNRAASEVESYRIDKNLLKRVVT